jgi:hypothetical protein
LHGLAQGRVTSEPFRGAPHTVAKIRRLAVQCQRHYPLRLLAEELIGRLDSKDSLSEILAVYYWVLAHTRYANDPRNVELVRSPREVLSRLQRVVDQLLPVAQGSSTWRPSLDCDDLVCLMVGLFLMIGREVQIVTVAFHDAFVAGQRQYSHVYIRVREPRTGTWIVLDPVAAEGATAMLGRVKAAHIWPVA